MQRSHKRALLQRVRRIVIKLGSSIVANAAGVDRVNVGRLVAEIARIHADGYQVVVVTSGARAAGLARLGLRRMPKSIPEQQAAAAIGQPNLMAIYESFFADFDQHVGQVLLTAADIESRARYLNAQHTLEHLMSYKIVPVVNENDSVAVDELKLGNNDRLSAMVAGLVGADLLILLTDVEGLYTDDPRSPDATLVDVVEDIESAARAAGGPERSAPAVWLRRFKRHVLPHTAESLPSSQAVAHPARYPAFWTRSVAWARSSRPPNLRYPIASIGSSTACPSAARSWWIAERWTLCRDAAEVFCRRASSKFAATSSPATASAASGPMIMSSPAVWSPTIPATANASVDRAARVSKNSSATIWATRSSIATISCCSTTCAHTHEHRAVMRSAHGTFAR